MKIDVIYDISFLGECHDGLAARTGIFRVTEEIANQLVNSDEVNVYFYASQKNFVSCNKYLEYRIDWSGKYRTLTSSVVFSSFQTVNNNIIIYLTEKSVANKRIGILFKIIRKFFKTLEVLLNSGSELSGELLKISNSNITVYHSSFYAIPSVIRQNKKIKNFVIIHDLIPLLYPDFFTKGIRKHIIKRLIDKLDLTTSVYCVSQSTMKDFLKYRDDYHPENVFLLHLGASDFFYKCRDAGLIQKTRSSFGIPEGSRYLLSLATLEPRKNFIAVLRAFRNLINNHQVDDLYLVLAGSIGWKNDVFFNEFNSMENLKERIILTGFVDDNNLAPLYSDALTFIYVSYYEGFGLPVLEAMKCGVPVISSNTSSLPEVVGDAGIMIDPDDVNALTDAIFQVYSNKSLRKKMSDNSFERSKLFSWRRCADDIVSGYKKVLKINGINSDSK